ncbi:hypothetical protein LMG31506_04226 [Cupriavidus yeoncheonensis]|uniref:Tripartite tricarboxylate transporter substrate binding protein n=1 Tax=Cupriavidus yeoncheonensis TaxID=1462994 RepID=A0A916IWV4_9BURK|nr:tripartite tricarboxylate transporter substrate binding protein [Cupriavidus yeoncheonensis]CAG2150567.1 hypothetical protein LMG31506_04226 [Cupriavidus yeoncheonensis]
MRKLGMLALAAAMAVCSGAANADTWPARPIRLVVPFPPGGGTDAVARLIAEKMSVQAHWTVVVENRPGAGGNVGLDVVAKAPADGYTIGLGQTANLAINPALYPKMPFDPLRDFAPVSTVASQPVVLLVNATSPFRTLKDVVAAARAKPESLRMGTPGNGTVAHLAGELLERQARFRLLNVPYKGASPAMMDLVGNQVEFNFANTAAAIPQLTSRKVRALAVTSAQRLRNVPQLAGVPTVAESGYAGFDAITWTGLVAPARTPQAVVERINLEVRKALDTREVQDKLAAEGSTPMGSTPQQFADYLRAEHQKWGGLIRDANIKLD